MPADAAVGAHPVADLAVRLEDQLQRSGKSKYPSSHLCRSREKRSPAPVASGKYFSGTCRRYVPRDAVHRQRNFFKGRAKTGRAPAILVVA